MELVKSFIMLRKKMVDDKKTIRMSVLVALTSQAIF